MTCTIHYHITIKTPVFLCQKAIYYSIYYYYSIDKPTTLVLGMCWWFSLTAKLISMFLRYCWSFFTVFCWLKSLAHKKIEILCLLSVKDIYESPFVYVWTFRFHCLLILYLYDFPCFKYSLTWWWQMDTISLFGFDRLQCLWEAETEEYVLLLLAAVSAIVNTKRWNAV